jgi:cytochrome c553
MKKVVVIVFAMLAGASGSTFAAGDAATGKSKSSICVACHGATGLSTNDVWPNLAGQKTGYLAKQLKAFREGARTDPLMSAMAKPLTDEDIENLAAYFSSLTAPSTAANVGANR